MDGRTPTRGYAERVCRKRGKRTCPEHKGGCIRCAEQHVCSKNNQYNCNRCVFGSPREPVNSKDSCLLSIVLYALPTLFLVMFFAQDCSSNPCL